MTPITRRPSCEEDGLGDWRIQAASRLAAAVPSAFPGGPAHAIGTPVHLVTAATDSTKSRVGFVTPSSAALALNIATKSSQRANKQHADLKFQKVLTPAGAGHSIDFRAVGPLFDYFEECICTVIFSFQALEAFANHAIAENLKGEYQLRRGKELRSVTAQELERIASTDEKLSTVLPTILSLASPKGKAVWGAFMNLKRTRDSSVHLKSHDQYPNQYTGGEERDSLFQQFMLNEDIAYFVRAAINMMTYFSSPGPRWLQAAHELCPGRVRVLSGTPSTILVTAWGPSLGMEWEYTL